MYTDLLEEIKTLWPQMITDRRYLHENPELSHKEYQTTEFIKKKLAGYKVDIEPLDIPTGVSALIKGARPGRTICIREDIDALPIEEETGLSFASKVKGVSHACGHDIHTVIALYCARLLGERREMLSGNVRFVFQPSEELCDGAESMIRAGLMELEPGHDVVVGLHTHPDTLAGMICLRKGPMEAAVCHLKITIHGKGGHGAHPYRCVDPVMTAAYLLTQLQTVITRENPAVKPAILTFGSIRGGTASNIIPDKVEILGTLRGFYMDCQEGNLKRIKRITRLVCESMGAKGTVETWGELPVLSNDSKVADSIIRAAETVIGKDNIKELEFPSPGSDDFSVFQKYSKGAQFFLGTANEDPCSRIGLHNAHNIFDERSIPTGVAVLTQYVLSEIGADI